MKKDIRSPPFCNVERSTYRLLSLYYVVYGTFVLVGSQVLVNDMNARLSIQNLIIHSINYVLSLARCFDPSLERNLLAGANEE